MESRRRVWAASLMALFAAMGTLGAATAAWAQQEAAGSADDFVDRIGVCTHWGFTDTPYGTSYDAVKKLLADAGIRHVRDGFHQHEVELFNDYGIRTTAIFSPPYPGAAVKIVQDNGLMLDMAEGPNEVDLFPKSAEYMGKGFPEGPRLFQNDLYTALKKSPATARVRVIAPSVGHPGANRTLRPLSGFDYLVMHSYAGGQMPSQSLESDINNNIQGAYDLIPPGEPLKPIVVTESGYHTALGSSVVIGGAQPGVSEKAQAKYLLRHFADYYNAGILRTFTYEFVDEFDDYKADERDATNAEACFGLIKHDLTPKPAYTALKNLIGLLSERAWNPKSKTWVWQPVGLVPHPLSVQFKPPAALNFTLTAGTNGDIKNLRHTILQKQNGDYYLLLWREEPSFDLKTKTDIDNPAVPVTLTLKTPIRGGAVYDPTVPSADPSQPLQPTQIFGPTQTVEIPVSDQLLAVQLTPVTPFPAPLLTREDKIAVRSTGTTVDLTWRAYGGPKPAGYFISRMDKYVGTTTAESFHEEGLRPGVGYTYTIRAFDAAGAVGAPVSAIAVTKAEFPDLIVTEVGMEPADGKTGAAVRFTATIKNAGASPTAPGVTLGVAFSIDGKVVSWADAFTGPLAPHESHTVTATNGPTGSATWTITPGKHTLRATVDDVNRVAESDKTNNTLEKSIGE